jgi:hypothetical protein
MVRERVSLRDYVRGFSKPFWAANVSELFERIAYYGMTPVLVPYLVQVRHFNERRHPRGRTSGCRLRPADRLGDLRRLAGYRRAMMLAYAPLAAGYPRVARRAHRRRRR